MVNPFQILAYPAQPYPANTLLANSNVEIANSMIFAFIWRLLSFSVYLRFPLGIAKSHLETIRLYVFYSCDSDGLITYLRCLKCQVFFTNELILRRNPYSCRWKSRFSNKIVMLEYYDGSLSKYSEFYLLGWLFLNG